jgi:transcriptional regulator with GAF, ATPase, and Fis domain
MIEQEVPDTLHLLVVSEASGGEPKIVGVSAALRRLLSSGSEEPHGLPESSCFERSPAILHWGPEAPPVPMLLVCEWVSGGLRHGAYTVAGPVASTLRHPALVRLAQELSRATTPRECAFAVVAACDEILGYDAAFVTLYPEDRHRMFSFLTIDTVDGRREEVLPPLQAPPTSGLAHRVLDSGPLRLTREHPYEPDTTHSRSFGNHVRPSSDRLYVPFSAEGSNFGILSVQKYDPGRYPQDGLLLLQEIASAASGALARTFSNYKLRQEESISRAFVALVRQFGGSTTVREAAEIILECANDLFGWDAAFINLCSADLKTLHPVITYDTLRGRKTVIEPSVPSSRPSAMARKVMDEGPQILLFDSIHRQPYATMKNFGDEGRLSNSLIFAPIRASGRTVGIMSIQSYEIAAYSPEDLTVFQSLADQCGAALTRLFAEENLRQKEEQLHDLEKENQLLREHLVLRPLQSAQVFSTIVTGSVRMRAVFHQVEATAPSMQPVLITGETGVGKELLAKAVHAASARTGAFIPVNVAGLDDELFSDSLFGHRRGAFTTAMGERRGFVDMAAKGTLFLDEIGDLSLASQVKLLRLLQEHEYYPIGSDTPKQSTARIVVATNQDLAEMMTKNLFRRDLYYRLQTHHIRIPALRERKEDIPLLLTHFVAESSQRLQKKAPRIPSEIPGLLQQHDFPGNIRELESIVYDAVSKCSGAALGTSVFEDRIRSAKGVPQPAAVVPSEPLDLERPVHFGRNLPQLKEVADYLVMEAMRRTQSNQSAAAKLLGVSQQALSQRLGAMRSGKKKPVP